VANLYYREELAADAFAEGALVEVTGDEARHAVRVSRLRAGERILVGNGAGVLGDGVVEAIAKDRFAVRVETVRHEPEPEVRIVLVQALAKGDRDERAVEQATEFGVDAVVPWEASRSVSRWGGSGGSGGESCEGRREVGPHRARGLEAVAAGADSRGAGSGAARRDLRCGRERRRRGDRTAPAQRGAALGVGGERRRAGGARDHDRRGARGRFRR
jgi:hypothetical protein